jgi:predicted Zn-dependent peptidase
VIRAELERITKEAVTEKELADSKTSISGRMTLGMEECNAQAEWFARQFLFGKKIETYEEILQKIKKVTVKDVQRVAKNIFVWNRARVAAIGSIKKSDLIKILK